MISHNYEKIQLEDIAIWLYTTYLSFKVTSWILFLCKYCTSYFFAHLNSPWERNEDNLGELAMAISKPAKLKHKVWTKIKQCYAIKHLGIDPYSFMRKSFSIIVCKLFLFATYMSGGYLFIFLILKIYLILRCLGQNYFLPLHKFVILGTPTLFLY